MFILYDFSNFSYVEFARIASPSKKKKKDQEGSPDLE
jgi:hypothetical protein